MARSEEHNRQARVRAREAILEAAITLFAERGVDGASVAEITRHAGVAQGLVSYHFGGKDQLISAVIDHWFETVIGFTRFEGTADDALAAVIDRALLATAFAVPLQRAVLSMQLRPATRRLFGESELRHATEAAAAEDAVREVFRARGAADPGLEEVMLRSVLDGVFVKYTVFGDTYPLEDARRWVRRIYGLPEPTTPLPLNLPPRQAEPRLRAHTTD